MRRARELLERANIPPMWHGDPWCDREDRLSIASIEMKNQRCLDGAKQRIRHTAKRFEGARGNAWLDRKKTLEELLPGRWCRRANISTVS